jgi:ribonuclease P protein component
MLTPYPRSEGPGPRAGAPLKASRTRQAARKGSRHAGQGSLYTIQQLQVPLEIPCGQAHRFTVSSRSPKNDASNSRGAPSSGRREQSDSPDQRHGPSRLTDQRLRRSERLRLKRDYTRVFEHKCRAADENLIVYVAPNDRSWSRLGLSVSRKVGKAVRRNRVRRWIREAFRTSRQELPTGVDIVCVAKPVTAQKTFEDVKASLVRLARRAYRQVSILGEQYKRRSQSPRGKPSPRSPRQANEARQ